MCGKKEKEYILHGSEGSVKAVFRAPERAVGMMPVVMIMHGFMSDMDQNPVKGIADCLDARGIATLRFDFNGHGRSDGFLHLATLESEVEDARHVYELACSLADGGSISFCGHSQGGVVAAMLAAELGSEKVRCLVELSPSAVFRKEGRTGMLMGKEYDPDNLDPDIAPCFYHVSRNTYSVAMAAPMLSQCFEYGGPVCLIQGDEDEVVPERFSKWSEERYPDCERHMIEGEHHAFDLRSEETMRLIEAFIEKNI